MKDLAERFGQWLDSWFGTPPPYVDPEIINVQEFLTKFGHLTHPGRPAHLTRRKLRERAACMQEELNEFHEGIELQDLAKQADALVDLVYFAKGTAVMLGLPWAELWDDVHGANMDKVPGVGPRGQKVDVIKPVGWIPPQTEAILVDSGYHRKNFTDYLDRVLEGRCRDDQDA